MEWIKIFASADEALLRLGENKPQLLLLGSKRICLVRREGRVFAVDDTCPHNGESLSKGTVNYLGEIICPWHGYRYELKTGRESAQRCRDLATYPTREDERGLYLGM